MIRRPPRSTLSSSSAASDVYKRQVPGPAQRLPRTGQGGSAVSPQRRHRRGAVSYTHLRAHETPEHLVCRLLLEKKKKKTLTTRHTINHNSHKNKQKNLKYNN